MFPQKKLEAAAHEEQRKHPDATVEIWAMDEHRIGLKPIVRSVWAPVGERPIALGHHRFEWLYVTGFVEPVSGRTVWNIANAVRKEMFELVLTDFAKSVLASGNLCPRRRGLQTRMPPGCCYALICPPRANLRGNQARSATSSLFDSAEGALHWNHLAAFLLSGLESGTAAIVSLARCK